MQEDTKVLSYSREFFHEKQESKIRSESFLNSLEKFIKEEETVRKMISSSIKMRVFSLFLYSSLMAWCTGYVYIEAMEGHWIFLMWSCLATLHMLFAYEHRNAYLELTRMKEESEVRQKLLTKCASLVKNNESVDKIISTLNVLWKVVLQSSSQEQKQEGEKTC